MNNLFKIGKITFKYSGVQIALMAIGALVALVGSPAMGIGLAAATTASAVLYFKKVRHADVLSWVLLGAAFLLSGSLVWAIIILGLAYLIYC